MPLDCTGCKCLPAATGPCIGCSQVLTVAPTTSPTKSPQVNPTPRPTKSPSKTSCLPNHQFVNYMSCDELYEKNPVKPVEVPPNT